MNIVPCHFHEKMATSEPCIQQTLDTLRVSIRIRGYSLPDNEHKILTCSEAGYSLTTRRAQSTVSDISISNATPNPVVLYPKKTITIDDVGFVASTVEDQAILMLHCQIKCYDNFHAIDYPPPGDFRPSAFLGEFVSSADRDLGVQNCLRVVLQHL